MDSKSQLTVDIIAKVSQGKITIANAAKLLNRSRRTIERYLNQYNQHGIQFVIHGNTGRKPSNKLSDTLRLKVQSLIKGLFKTLLLIRQAYLAVQNDVTLMCQH